jgi:hypothetical protein
MKQLVRDMHAESCRPIQVQARDGRSLMHHTNKPRQSREGNYMNALIPLSPNQLDGPFEVIEDDFYVVARCDQNLLIEFHEQLECAEWVEEFELVMCEIQPDGESFKLIRMATEDDLKLFRIPEWLQGPETPECCGQPMHFVEQTFEDEICDDDCTDAELECSEVVARYDFYCKQCSECQVVTQEY